MCSLEEAEAFAKKRGVISAYDIAEDLEREGKFPGHVCYGTSPLLVRAANKLRNQADRIADLETTLAFKKMKPLSDEEIYALWCEADNTELLPEMRLNDGSINYIITTFAKLIEERHGIK